MTELIDPLVESLLYEGYALYPYTPDATKNSTPTPFGIVYPPAYASALDTTYDHLRVDCLIEAEPDARLTAEARFLVASGPRHEARPRTVALPATALSRLAAQELVEEVVLDEDDGELALRLRLSASPPHNGCARILFWVENRTRVASGLGRGEALRRSLLSTHPSLRVDRGRFLSPCYADSPNGCASINTFPVLASAADDVVLGAAIVLPDHPQIAAESRGGLFDSTEIEEALLLHVQALSDGERGEIEAADPTIRAMIARAEAATPEDLRRLHGRVTLRDRETREPPTPSSDVPDPTRGEPQAIVDGVAVRPGGHVVLRPGSQADLHARMAAGRQATVEKILVDYDGRVHFGVTIDGDPGQQLLRETGRLLYFFAAELEVMS